MRHLIAASAVCLAAMPALAVEIIAHRGASYDAPENTLAAVRLGWEQGADAVEFDIWLSKDGHIVLMHDKDTDRIGGRKKLVKEQTLDELRQLDVGAWKDERFRGERIPTLPEVLATIPRDRKVFVEIKDGPEILPALKRDFDEAAVADEQITIIGFDYETMARARKLFPKYTLYWLSSLKQDPQTGEYGPPRDELIRKAKAIGVEGLNLQARPIIDADYVQAVKAAGLQMYVWTVNDAAEARRLAEAGVDGITTDRPGYLREELGVTAK
jgi:glycerophosphoryl diester phosphodiesterase